jgi:hypothetical protein
MSSWPNPEELIRLAKQDPEALEALRLREVESVIQGAPPSLQKRLRDFRSTPSAAPVNLPWEPAWPFRT